MENDIVKTIQRQIFENKDIEYKNFQSKLIPNIEKDCIIGVRTPILRKIAKSVSTDERKTFMSKLPHKYFEENQLQAFFISDIKDEKECYIRLGEFLPYVNNWATCDQMCPKVFKKNKENLIEYIKIWLDSKEEYTVRFAIKMLMTFFLDSNFNKEYLYWIAQIDREEYYIKMMQAWYFATALAKQYEKTICIFEEQVLDDWVHNKSIQKAIESRRIARDIKEYLKKLKVR
ncbi:DNA alkylation repair protein [Lachnobacterium bovis]|uniref:3-methyladenine DNA glycosylase AlkD n=1 Tax=Lachnobacterium bovis TaxID=140626 RepID=A0A1H9SYL3_9FIRM|nr:DNA alkylation repair protein [Lachnobacterium bovis]SER89958.1 3-methyladenine DNA glycosylase AlkD [Lachnobacterium bovis]